MTPYAVISDIHANLAALVAILADIRKNHISRIICLGDIVGYGPDPRECLTLVRRNCDVVLKGNHDLATLVEPFGFNPWAHKAVIWTRRKIRKRWCSSGEVRRNWKMLKKSPERHEEDGMLFVHGSPRDPINEYVDIEDTHCYGFGPDRKIVEIMSLFERHCFAGHTHNPGIINEDYQFLSPSEFDFVWPNRDDKLFINVGSVGQPRDGDPNAKYVIVRQENIEFRKVPYDINETVEKIKEVKELHESLAERLRKGV